MKHIHHIIPRHMGGSDDPSNLIELSVKEHSEAHLWLWLKYGKTEDKIAWKGLSGQIGKDEIMREVHKMAGIKSGNQAVQNGTWRNVQIEGGKASYKQKKGIHNPDKRDEWSSKGGSTTWEKRKLEYPDYMSTIRTSESCRNGGLSVSKENRSKAGSISCSKEYICPKCGKIGKGPSGIRHIKNCKQ